MAILRKVLLEHEHQRWDRDAYLNYDPNSKTIKDLGFENWGEKVKQEAVQLEPGVIVGFNFVTVKILLMTINVPIPVYGTQPKVIYNGTEKFDYLSIMLYSTNQLYSPETFPVNAKVAQQGLRIGDLIPYNNEISAGDIETVKKMYP